MNRGNGPQKRQAQSSRWLIASLLQSAGGYCSGEEGCPQRRSGVGRRAFALLERDWQGAEIRLDVLLHNERALAFWHSLDSATTAWSCDGGAVLDR